MDSTGTDHMGANPTVASDNAMPAMAATSTTPPVDEVEYPKALDLMVFGLS